MYKFSQKYIKELVMFLTSFPYEQFEQMISTLIEAYRMNHTIFVMGNGGSGATASHWACDINKGCSFNRDKKFRMMCLNDNVATILAYANDISYDDIFVEQLKNFFNPGDVVIGISGSGNSTNVLKAIQYANKHEGVTIGLCGFNGGKLRRFVDIPILAKIHDMQKVEDVHTIISHMAMQRVCQILDSYQSTEVIKEATG
jgi:D-sedoheptulose 7-phosphate isomerase